MTTQMIPYLHIQGAARAIEFYQKAFGATEVLRLTEPEGKVGHAEIPIGGARIMLADEYPEHGVLGPKSLGGTSVSLHLTVPDVDAFARQAVAAGAKLPKPDRGRVLRRADRQAGRPVRARLARHDPHRGGVARGDAAAV